MDSKKVFIIVLVILVLLYVASLGMGVAFNSDSEADLGQLERRAKGTIGSVFEAFADRLVLDGLECNGANVADVFTLDFRRADSPSCELFFNPPLEDDDEFVKTELRLAPRPVGQAQGAAAPPKVFLFAGFTEENFPQADRDREKCFLDRDGLPAYRLELRYTPGDAPSTDWQCWLERELPLSLTVTRGGGTLAMTLVCDDCGNRDRRRLELRMK